mmetsp:Transcript_52037/g.169025  ORF Transcript_52037/g.169025 Transcript_52037/m.169025 type:complete len:223 (-) Transcript_52037:1798-2466(-)
MIRGVQKYFWLPTFPLESRVRQVLLVTGACHSADRSKIRSHTAPVHEREHMHRPRPLLGTGACPDCSAECHGVWNKGRRRNLGKQIQGPCPLEGPLASAEGGPTSDHNGRGRVKLGRAHDSEQLQSPHPQLSLLTSTNCRIESHDVGTKACVVHLVQHRQCRFASLTPGQSGDYRSKRHLIRLEIPPPQVREEPQRLPPAMRPLAGRDRSVVGDERRAKCRG